MASDPMAPAHSDGDEIVSEETNTGGGAVGRVTPLEVPGGSGGAASTGSKISEDEDFAELAGEMARSWPAHFLSLLLDLFSYLGHRLTPTAPAQDAQVSDQEVL